MTPEQDNAATGLVCAYELDGSGGAQRIEWDEVGKPAPPGRTRWIHLDFTDTNAREWVRRGAGIEAFIADTLLAEDSRPRVVEHGDGLLVTLRGVNRNPGAEPEDMVSVRLWIQPQRIVSTRRRRLLSVTAIRDGLENGTGPADTSAFLRTLVENLGDRIAPVIDELDEALEAAEESIERDTARQYTGRFTGLRRQAMRIRRFLAPQRDGLERLARQQAGVLSESDRFEIREEADRVTRYLEDLDLVRERAMVAQEELLAKMAQEQNSRMYLLSMVAALFLPLSFVTGLMGMNVAGLPGTENPMSFAILVLLMFGVAAAILAMFRWKKWL